MRRFRTPLFFLPFLAALLLAAAAGAQAPPEPKLYEPIPYQEGKDVVWVPTAQALADKMLNLARVTPQDYVVDLGSGDGRLVITAAKRGARAMGVEYNPELVALSQRNARNEGVAERVRFLEGDLFDVDFSGATVLTMFLLQDLNLKLRPKILGLRPGTRVVSNTFDMDDWTPDQVVHVSRDEGCDNHFCQAFLWIVPARVEGTWKTPQGRLLLVQRFQRIFGELQTEGGAQAVTGRVEGDQVRFTAGGRHYEGRFMGGAIVGAVREGEKTGEWVAHWTDGRLR